MDVTEDELVAAIRKVLSGKRPGVVLGVGDDAAVVEPGGGQQVLTADMLVEGVHFDRASISPRDLGAKSIVVNLSDVAAMAASPRFALVSLALTADLDASWVIELEGGMRAACDEYALALVGGDVNRATEIVIAVTVIGEVAPGRALTRTGARPGDRLVVTGSLGAAAGGLVLSRAHPARLGRVLKEPWGSELLAALARPVARVGEAQTLAQAGATAMMDLSDGFAKDLTRMCAESHVGARVELARLPVSPSLEAGAAALGVDALRLAIGGGEDYELLATIPAGSLDAARDALDERFGVALSDVGVVVEGQGLVGVDARGLTSPLAAEGWDHFGDG